MGRDRGGTRVTEGHSPALVERYAVSDDCTHREFLAAAKLYARAVADRHGLTVPVADLDWGVSTRAKRRAGAVEYRDGDPVGVSLAWAQFESEGWAATAATVRHELVHVHLLAERSDAGHGPAFRDLADRLDAPVSCERFADPEWWVTCTDCGARLARYRRSKLVRRPEDYRCGDCGGRLRVEAND
jgi:predicted SprT family Zn-dependent metalloprotease